MVFWPALTSLARYELRPRTESRACRAAGIAKVLFVLFLVIAVVFVVLAVIGVGAARKVLK